MSSRFGSLLGVAGLACIALAAGTAPSPAVTVEVAKICRALTTKAFPPREIANPAAGSAKGSGRDQTSYFNKCVVNGGKVDSDPKP